MGVCKIIGAFDTETTNIGDSAAGYQAFPVLYQYGSLSCPVEQLTVENCKEKVDVLMFRHSEKLYSHLDSVFENVTEDDIGVILVHNLAFDMYSLAPWLDRKQCKVLAKTSKKPITITILEKDKPRLVFLDTLGLFMKSLSRLGQECGMPKFEGDWDYMKIRTPETPLTDGEIAYAKQDIYTLLCYVSYFLLKNPDISPEDIGRHVVTKTGIVRAKRMKHLGSLKGDGQKRTVNQLWNYHNRTQKPKSDNELFTMHACTRGGFTFCARNHASEIFEAKDEYGIYAYDATSMHPSAMVSHYYPLDFSAATKNELVNAIEYVRLCDSDRILSKWWKPFNCAFNACFAFENLRPKQNTLYDAEGVFPLASARLGPYRLGSSDNESTDAFEVASRAGGYKDMAENPHVRFGKIESADYCELWLTELGLWEVLQAYDFDSIEPLGGYLTMNFRKPTDLAVLSVMRFYKAKNTLKEVMYGENPTVLQGFFPDSFVTRMIGGDAVESEIKEYYQLAKADLNSLFG